MNYLEVLENHIKDNKDDEFIKNCFQAIGQIGIKEVVNYENYPGSYPNILRYMVRNRMLIVKNTFIINFMKKFQKDDEEIVKAFLDAGVNPTLGDNYALRLAKQMKFEKICEVLEEAINSYKKK